MTLGSPNHGGRTVAALVNVRSHIAKIVISSAIERRATRSGWRKPAVVSETCLQVGFRHIADYIRSTTPTAG
jgi:hypothetical protein